MASSSTQTPQHGAGLSELAARLEIKTEFTDTHQTRHVKTVKGTTVRTRRMEVDEVWERRKPLGSGTYGSVWLEELVGGSHAPGYQVRAVKSIQKPRENMANAVGNFARELDALSYFSREDFSSLFVQTFGWFQSPTAVFISMEYFRNGDLQRYLDSPFPEPQTRQIAYQLTEGLAYMHKNGFAHRDLKPGNIFVHKRGPAWWVKIGDFGISKRIDGTLLRTRLGTPSYMAPELRGIFTPEDRLTLRNSEIVFGPAVDFWSLGEIVHKLITGGFVFPEHTPWALTEFVMMGDDFPDDSLRSANCSDSGIDFVHRAMEASPLRRFKADEALGHVWLAEHEIIEEPEHDHEEDSGTQTNMDSDNEYTVPPIYEPSLEWTTLGSEQPQTGMQLRIPQMPTPSRHADQISPLESRTGQPPANQLLTPHPETGTTTSESHTMRFTQGPESSQTPAPPSQSYNPGSLEVTQRVSRLPQPPGIGSSVSPPKFARGQIGQNDLPEEIEVKEAKGREMEEDPAYRDVEGSYMDVEVVTPHTFLCHGGLDLAIFDGRPGDPSTPKKYRVPRTATMDHLVALVAEDVGAKPNVVRLWTMCTRQNKTIRPDFPITDTSRTIEESYKFPGYTFFPLVNFRLWAEIADMEDSSGRAIWPKFTISTRGVVSSDVILLLLKCFDAETQILQGVGHMYMSKKRLVNDLVPQILRMMGWDDKLPPGDEIFLWEEIKPTLIDPLQRSRTLAASELQNGDIVCFQRSSSRDQTEEKHRSVVDARDYYKILLDQSRAELSKGLG